MKLWSQEDAIPLNFSNRLAGPSTKPTNISENITVAQSVIQDSEDYTEKKII